MYCAIVVQIYEGLAKCALTLHRFKIGKINGYIISRTNNHL